VKISILGVGAALYYFSEIIISHTSPANCSASLIAP